MSREDVPDSGNIQAMMQLPFPAALSEVSSLTGSSLLCVSWWTGSKTNASDSMAKESMSDREDEDLWKSLGWTRVVSLRMWMLHGDEHGRLYMFPGSASTHGFTIRMRNV